MRTGHAPLVPGRYDIVIDANQNGVYDASADGLDSGSPGFVVVAGAPPTHQYQFRQSPRQESSF